MRSDDEAWRMRAIGVIEDGFAFTEAEIARGAPRFWWGARKRAAYQRVLDRRGIARRDEGGDGDGGSDSGSTADRRDGAAAGTAAAATVAIADAEKRLEAGTSGGSWFSGGADGGAGSSDGGASSGTSGGSDGGGGGSGQ
jgi:hypothetical protein